MTFARAGLAVGLLAVLLGACTSTRGHAASHDPSPGAARSTSRPAGGPSPLPPSESWRRNRACVGSRAVNPKAAAYEGAAPHLITQEWFHGSYEGETSAVLAKGYYPRADVALVAKVYLPENWTVGALQKYADTAAQLLLCHTATPTGHRVGTCRFDIVTGSRRRTYPVESATHHFAVYETRTGHPVTAFDLPGSEPARASCPEVAQLYDHSVIAQAVDPGAVSQRLTPLATGPARQ